MTDQPLHARSAFSKMPVMKGSKLEITALDDLSIASIAVAKDQLANLQSTIGEAYGVALPLEPQRVVGKDIAFLWSGPGQWLAIAERGAGRDLEVELKPKLAGLAAVVDLSDGRQVARISGPRARDVLAKGVPIDLHPRAFKANDVAITHASHIGVILWQVDDAPSYDVAMFRSFADSFMHWLKDSAAEFQD